MQDNYTKEHRHATETLLRGFVTDIVDGIAAARGLDPKQVYGALMENSMNDAEYFVLSISQSVLCSNKLATFACRQGMP